MKLCVEKIIKDSIEVKKLLLGPGITGIIERIAGEIVSSFNRGGTALVFGNGGSASDAQHMVCELVGRFRKERKGLPAICLASNASNMTAISNDYSYDESFKRQIEAFGNRRNIAIAISTSGNAPNVIEAVKKAKKLKMRTIALTGKEGGELSRHADISLIVPSDDTPRIQEAHILIIHILCELIENSVKTK